MISDVDMNSELPFVSVIIPTFNDWQRLSMCLDSLSSQSYPADRFEIIVVNNKPEDHAPEGFKGPINCLLIDEGKPGSYAARNSALGISRGEIVGFTDSDCIADRHWIHNAILIFLRQPDVQRIGGIVSLFFRAKRPSKVELNDKVFAFPQENYVKAGNAVTANMFSRKGVFDEIGAFDDSLKSGGDYQWGMLAQRRGFKIVFARDVIINHPARASLKDLLNKEKRIGIGQAAFLDSPIKSVWQLTYEMLRILKPRTWEIKRIFNREKDLSLLDKISLIGIRHYIKFVGNATRIVHSYKVYTKNIERR